MCLITFIQIIPNLFTFPRRLCRAFFSDHGNMEQVWDEKDICGSPSFSSKLSFCTELIFLTLGHVAHNQMPYRNLSILFQSTYLIKRSLYVIGTDRKLLWRDWYSIKPCRLTLTELQLLIFCLLYIRISVKLYSL